MDAAAKPYQAFNCPDLLRFSRMIQAAQPRTAATAAISSMRLKCCPRKSSKCRAADDTTPPTADIKAAPIVLGRGEVFRDGLDPPDIPRRIRALLMGGIVCLAKKGRLCCPPCEEVRNDLAPGLYPENHQAGHCLELPGIHCPKHG